MTKLNAGARGTFRERRQAVAPRKRPPGRPTLRESKDLRSRIEDAAIAEFATHGFEFGNVNRIAEAAGATKATVYRLYESKENLFKVAMRKALSLVKVDPWDMETERDPEEVLTEVADKIALSYTRGTVTPLWHSVVAVKRRFPEFHDEILALLQSESIAASVATYLANLHRRGVLDIPHPLMTAHHFSLLVGQGRELGLPPHATEEQEQERIRQVVRMFIRGHAPDHPPDLTPKEVPARAARQSRRGGTDRKIPANAGSKRERK